LSLNVLFVAAEADPFAKVGGMADVVGSLPMALRRLGVDARVILPFYGSIDVFKYHIVPLFEFTFPRRTGDIRTQVYTTTYHDVPFYFVRGEPFFGHERAVYSDWEADAPRFIYFNQVAMAVAWEIKQREGWFPNVFHINDWHTGLIPFLLYESRNNPDWEDMASLLSIHNLAYQGDHVGGWLWELGIPGRHQPDLVFQNRTDNLLGIAIAYSDIVTTVSPRYAIEIQYPSFMQHGLDGLIRTRVDDLYGILNGIDTELWNPETDKNLASNYSVDTFPDKRPPNKAHLQKETGLEVRPDVPLIGVVSRLVWQKGFDLALPALRRLLTNTDMQLVVLGSGEPDLDYQFWKLGQDFPDKARVFHGYNPQLAPRIYAGCDIFLMPSHYEPCGIGQMLAMRYGALPLVRETGGLADTVENYDKGVADRGTGFVFTWEQSDAVLNTLKWALETYHERPEVWERMQRRAMEKDFSWERSARDYVDLYEKAVLKRKGEKNP
jgi:starch synthase